ncbi:MAG: DUF4382 domain-containing protein [Chthonomonadales bacterium]
MKRKSSLFSMLALSAALGIGLVGCGGGSGSGGSSTRSAPTNVFVTDGFGDLYSQVWVTLFSIDLQADGSSTFTNVYSSATGIQVNLADLSTVAQLLNTASIPVGKYSKAKITFGDHFTVVPSGGTVSQSIAVAPNVGVQSGGQVAITVNMNTNITAGTTNKVIVDFDLAAFQLITGKIVPSCKQGDEGEFNLKTKRGEYEGVVSNLVAGSSFQIVRGTKTLNIAINSNTVVMSDSTGATGVLANGQNVEVKGTFDPTTQILTATTIKVNDTSDSEDDDHGDNNGGGGHSDHHRSGLEGVVKSVNTVSSYFEVTIHEIEHFQLPGATIHVIYTNSTVFHKRGATSASIADVVAGVKVEVVGTFDPIAKTITAARVEINGTI